MKLDSLLSVTNVAKFLGTQEKTVRELIEEDRLRGALIATLSRRGVPVTPGLKNSVETVVQALSPKQSRSAFNPGAAGLAGTESTVTIMFTDLVDSTAMTDRLGDRDSRKMFRAHNEIIRQQVEAHGGIEVKSMGDGFMLTFQSSRRGVACAAAIQKDLREFNKEKREAKLEVRMGLSVGEPIHEEEDLFGKSVILAARISAKAQGEQILICRLVHALVSASGEFVFREVGNFNLKGISDTHTLYEVLWRKS